MKLVKNEELARLAKEFFQKYMGRGLGGYSGRELELLVLDFLIAAYPELRDSSLFNKSRMLKATETKIKNMLYEIKLKSDEDNDEFRMHIEKNLESAEYEKGKFLIEIDDVYTQRKIKSILKDNGCITDSSFNTDLVKMPYEGLISIVEVVYEEKSKTKVYKDLIATKRLAATNREILRSVSIPGTELSTGNLWDMVTSATTSITSAISAKQAAAKAKNQSKDNIRKK